MTQCNQVRFPTREDATKAMRKVKHAAIAMSKVRNLPINVCEDLILNTLKRK